MATVIRIKRNLNEDPLDAVLLNCKRRKTDNVDVQDVTDLSAVLKFAGTFDNPEEDVFKHIKKPAKSETEDQYKKRTSDIVTKLRKENQESSKNNRYKVVNSFRSQGSTLQQDAAASDVNCTIVDIESDENKENIDVGKNANNSNSQFVYDLYYTNSDDFGEADLNEFISVYPLSDAVIYNSHRDKNTNDSDSEYSEDSNAENNWKNDYPDESDVESPEECDDDSINEVDMLRAMNKVALDNDLSSDDYDGAFGYDKEEEYGEQYPKIKSKMKNMDGSFCYYDDYDDSCTP